MLETYHEFKEFIQAQWSEYGQLAFPDSQTTLVPDDYALVIKDTLNNPRLITAFVEGEDSYGVPCIHAYYCTRDAFLVKSAASHHNMMVVRQREVRSYSIYELIG